MSTTVALINCTEYDPERVERALRRALDLLGGISRFVKPGDKVLLKPNLLAARTPEKCVTTHPAVVRAVAKAVRETGGTPFIADSPGIEPFALVAARSGMTALGKELGIAVEELSGPTAVPASPEAMFKRLEVARQALEADVVINLPKLKTHCQMLFTLGVKNLFGTVVAQRKSEWHHMAGVSRDIFASLLLDIYRAVKPALTILDGIWAMEGRGPSSGTPRQVNLLAAATDAVALDVSVCKLLQVPLRSFPFYRAARERRIGETDPAKIRLVGDPPESFLVRDFHVPRLDALGMLPGIIDPLAARFLVSKPTHDKTRCTDCGLCVKICPASALKIDHKQAQFDYDRCIRCYCCQEICPGQAIRFQQGLLVRVLNRLHR